MKIAILISGSPRFTKELDDFISNLKGFESADWFISLWKENNQPDKLGYPGFVLVSDNWRNIDLNWAKNKIEQNLPPNHKLCKLELHDHSIIQYPTISGPQEHHINFLNIWKMHLGWNLVEKLRQSHNEEYDLVIRIRPDLALTEPVNLLDLKKQLENNPKLVFVAKNGQHGITHHINDLIAISTPDNITTYTDLINHSLEYNNSGIIFHPENMLAYHLIKNGLSIKPIIPAEIRLYFTKRINAEFVSDFGRWG